jgi:hypothetical protein
MAINENVPEFPAEGRLTGRNPRSVLHPLHEAAMRLAEIGMPRPKSKSAKTKDLINLLCRTAPAPGAIRSRRSSIHLHVTNPEGRAPVKLRLR